MSVVVVPVNLPLPFSAFPAVKLTRRSPCRCLASPLVVSPAAGGRVVVVVVSLDSPFPPEAGKLPVLGISVLTSALRRVRGG